MKMMVLDGNSLAYRAFFALPADMATASGQVTNAVFGFASMLSNLLKEHRPDTLAVVFDRPEPTFRHEAVPEYKAQRESAPDILRQQMGIIRELLEALGVTSLDMAGFEGDDIIATLSRRCEASGDDVIIVTGDRDSYQLVRDPHVKVLYNKRGVSDYAIYDEAGILERTGVPASRYVDYAALRGDPSDNLVGANGVGEKTAAKLVNEYPDLAAILDAADKQTPKLRASLEESRDRVLRNASVMVLRDDLDIDVDPRSCIPQPNHDAVQRLLDFLEMKNMRKRLDDAFSHWSSGSSPAASSGSGESSRGELTTSFEFAASKSAKDVRAALAGRAHIGVGATWSGPKNEQRLVSVALATEESAWVVPGDNVGLLGECLADAPRLVGHDVKKLMRALLESGFPLGNVVFDTAIAAYLIDPVEGGHDLGGLVNRRLGIDLPTGSAAESSGQLDFGGDDATSHVEGVVSARAALLLESELRADLESQGMRDLYESIEHPLVGVLAKMEVLGVAVDKSALEAINADLVSRVAALAEDLHRIAGRAFNINSPTQLQQILYEERGLTKGKKTKTGYSTDAATLEKLREEWPEFIEPLLTYRELEKLRGTYGQGLVDAVGKDGRIHAVFNQTVARTGRLSSEHPNLHNIPVRSDEGRVFRTAFVASKGCELLVADYNQIELRCIAHLADDPGLIGAFNDGVDIHNATAARVFGVDPKKVTHDQRSKAKMVSYGLAYGMEAYGLSQRLGIGVDEASEILEAYFAAFPSVRSYMDRTVTEARNKGYTETLFGRRRLIPELRSDNFRVRQAGERQAMNAGIQGLAADIFKIALVRIDEALEREGLASRLVLQVHDEVLVEAPVEEKKSVEPLVLGIMRDAASLAVPLEVNAAWGATWAAAK
jgi:DNA polymerase-1